MSPDEEADLERAVGAFVAALFRLGPAAHLIKGRVVLRLAGTDRSWALDFDEPRGPVLFKDLTGELAERRPTDSEITGTALGLMALVRSPEQIGELLRSRALRVEGERQRLAKLARLLGQQGSALSIRARVQGGLP